VSCLSLRVPCLSLRVLCLSLRVPCLSLRVLCLLLSFGVGSVVRADEDPSEPSPAPLIDIKDAELHAKLASALFKVGNYLEAASELNLAYALVPQPIYLFNIAQAYRKAQRAAAAKVMYEKFLEAAPNHPLAPEARGYMADMEALAHAQEARNDAQEALSREKQRPKPIYKRPVFWGVLGTVVGVSAIAIGLGIGLSRRDPATNGGIVDLSLVATF
jgi:hypothetical protein